MNINNKYVDLGLTVFLMIFGAIAGFGLLAYLDNCSGLSCSDDTTVAEKTETLDVATGYVTPDVENVPTDIEEWDINLPASDMLDLPVSITSEAYIESVRLLLTNANELELILRQEVPEALYAIQTAAIDGELQPIFDAVLNGQVVATEAEGLNEKFLEKLLVFEATSEDLTNEEIRDLSLGAAAQGRIAQNVAEEYLDLTLRLSVPEPPKQQDIDAAGPMGDAIQTEFEAFAALLEALLSTIERLNQS